MPRSGRPTAILKQKSYLDKCPRRATISQCATEHQAICDNTNTRLSMFDVRLSRAICMPMFAKTLQRRGAATMLLTIAKTWCCYDAAHYCRQRPS